MSAENGPRPRPRLAPRAQEPAHPTCTHRRRAAARRREAAFAARGAAAAEAGQLGRALPAAAAGRARLAAVAVAAARAAAPRRERRDGLRGDGAAAAARTTADGLGGARADRPSPRGKCRDFGCTEYVSSADDPPSPSRRACKKEVPVGGLNMAFAFDMEAGAIARRRVSNCASRPCVRARRIFSGAPRDAELLNSYSP